MIRKVTFMLLGLALTVGAACGNSTAGATGSPTPAATSSPLASASAVPVSYDPCVLMPASEAQALTGVSYTAGKLDVSNNTKRCIYGAQTANVLTIGVLQAPDQATAQAGKAQFEADLQSQAAGAYTVTQVQGVGDAADVVEGSVSANGQTISGSAIYVMKGLVVFFITDLAVGKSVPTGAALQAEATTIVGRL